MSKNWVVHNLVSHPLSEIVYWIVKPFSVTQAIDISGRIHDWSIPSDHDGSNGRG